MMRMDDCPIRRLWCQFIFPCINTSVDMRVKFPKFIGSIHVPDMLHNKLTYICVGHISNVRSLASNLPATIYSVTVYGSLRQPLYSSLASVDTDLGQHGAKAVQYLSFGGYGELTCTKEYTYGVQTAIHPHAHETQHMKRRDYKMWNFSLHSHPASYPRHLLAAVNTHHHISRYAYGEQELW
jgi:hypothetical protein